MIHFDFVVEDVDAENIFDCINSEINRCNDRKFSTPAITLAEYDWLDRHIAYLNELKKKMINTREV